MDHLAPLAHQAGPIARYRVVCIESDARVTMRDFDQLADAVTYANDVAFESDVPAPLAAVFDANFERVHTGRR